MSKLQRVVMLPAARAVSGRFYFFVPHRPCFDDLRERSRRLPKWS
jgi:hypothetical protein